MAFSLLISVHDGRTFTDLKVSVGALEAEQSLHGCARVIVLLPQLGHRSQLYPSGGFALPSQPTRAVIADNCHRLRSVVYAAWYLNVLGFRQLETRTQHVRARPFDEAFARGAG